MLDFESEDGPEIVLVLKKELVKSRPEVIETLVAGRSSFVLGLFCVTLTFITLISS